METRPPFDRSLFIPAFIGIFSLVGICLLLLALRFQSTLTNAPATETVTPLEFQYLGTEPGTVLPTAADTPTAEEDTSPIAPTEVSTLELTPTTFQLPPTATRQSFPNTATSTWTVVPVGGTYDDTDFRLVYQGAWISQSGVVDSYQNTLHVSNTIGNYVQLSFVGQQIQIAFEAGPSLGAMAVRLDDTDYAVDEATVQTSLNVWQSPELKLSSHTVRITHVSGGSINLDAIIVLDLSTPTATATPTQ